MFKNTSQENNINYVLRRHLETLINIYGENESIYLIFKPDNTILNITKSNNELKYYTDVTIYLGTLKNAYLFLLIAQYPHISQDLLIFKANKILKQYSNEELIKLLEVTNESFNKFNRGLSEFKNQYAKEKISTKMKFNIQEFDLSLNKTFKKVV